MFRTAFFFLLTVCTLVFFTQPLCAQEVKAPATQAAPKDQAEENAVSPEAAFALMAGEAEKGNADAMLSLGNFYEQGVGVPRHFVKAREWYEKAAKAGLPAGAFNAGLCYEIGIGSDGDMTKAVQYYTQAADLGSPQGLYKMAQLHAAGTGVARDDAKVFEYLVKAADAKHIGAALELGAVYIQGGLGQPKDEKKAMSVYAKAANQGSLGAIVNLAVMYKDGIGVKADPALALKWYTIARTGGVQAQDMDAILDEVKKSLTPAQIAAAETEAAKWAEEFAKRSAAQ